VDLFNPIIPPTIAPIMPPARGFGHQSAPAFQVPPVLEPVVAKMKPMAAPISEYKSAFLKFFFNFSFFI
jgi:hypothetical protein